MKTKEELLKEIENIGVFTIKNGEYLCTGYHIDVTNIFVGMYIDLKMAMRPIDKRTFKERLEEFNQDQK